MKNKAQVLIIIFLVHIVAATIPFGIPPLSPFILEALDITKAEFGLFMSLFYMGLILLSFGSGWIVDYLGMGKSLFLGKIILVISVSMFSLINHYWIMLFFALVIGVGYSFINPGTTKAVMYWFPVKHRGAAMGFKQTGVTVGSMLAAFVLPFLAVNLGWRTALLLMSVLAFVMAFVCRFKLQEKGDNSHNSHNERDAGRENGVNLNLKEIKERILFSLRQVDCRPIVVVSLLIGILVFSQASFITYLVLFINEELLFPVAVSTIALGIAQGSGTAGRVAWGYISDRALKGNRKKTLSLIGTIAALVFVSFLFLTPDSPNIIIYFLAGAGGFSILGYNAVYLTLIGELAGEENTGISSGLSISITHAGILLVNPLFGYLVDTLGTFYYSWLFLSVLLFLVSAAFIWMDRKQ